MRFELVAGKPPSLVLEPWEQRDRRLWRATARTSSETDPHLGTPTAAGAGAVAAAGGSKFDVYLLGTGLPSFWVADMGDMQLTLGLSGWTANDWTRGSALDLLAPPRNRRRI